MRTRSALAFACGLAVGVGGTSGALLLRRPPPPPIAARAPEGCAEPAREVGRVLAELSVAVRASHAGAAPAPAPVPEPDAEAPPTEPPPGASVESLFREIATTPPGAARDWLLPQALTAISRLPVGEQDEASLALDRATSTGLPPPVFPLAPPDEP